ncbi:hypothetical protein DD238_005562 [Peronospora effusa]|uniref:SREBP regulating gene protein n=1 Tax=Peronospora effusa TaxID=542832 RepID=A0A3M6VEM6_9STRA|nr:hypothetical protein DD238_005562 [Peronospora effusa]
MLRGVNQMDDDDESYKTDDELLDDEAFEWRAQPGQHAPNKTRGRLFMAAVMFVSQVFMELGRRSLSVCSPTYRIVYIDRWLVQTIRVSMSSGRKMSMLRLLLALGLAFVLPYLVLTIGRMHFSTGRGKKVSVEDLDDDKIRSCTLVDQVDTLVPERRQMFLREECDRLQMDETELRCENTVQGVDLLPDSIGYVCTRSQLD